MGLSFIRTYQRLETFWFSLAPAWIYALCRIAFGLVSLLNLIFLYPHRYQFFSPTGLTDQDVVLRLIQNTPYYSIFYHIDSPSAVDGVFFIAIIASIGLIFGFLGRLCSIILFLWSMSYTSYAFTGMHSWDFLLRIYAFVLMISPLGSFYSLDRYSLQRFVPFVSYNRMVSHHGLLLLKVQLVIVYWQTLWLKLPDQYWRNGELISYFMMSMYSRFPSIEFAYWPIFSNIMTYGSLLLECFLPILLWKKRYRRIGIFLGCVFHLSIMATSHIVMFSLTTLIMYIAFLKEEDKDLLQQQYQRWKNRN